MKAVATLLWLVSFIALGAIELGSLLPGGVHIPVELPLGALCIGMAVLLVAANYPSKPSGGDDK